VGSSLFGGTLGGGPWNGSK